MRIGELAAAAGLTTKTIRFYEGEGLRAGGAGANMRFCRPLYLPHP
ncbi:MAG: hypothetical protein CL696_14735 [Chloroflexi bacterium]|nr:hypothetical protein [Chloroflexota bacterium]